MKILKFEIENYRAINKVTIPLVNNLNPIIGINESGKTTILKAILCFDKLKDNYNKGEHLDFKNKYYYKKQGPSYIRAFMLIESTEELTNICKNLSLKVGCEEHTILTTWYENKIPITISRNLETTDYAIETDNQKIADIEKIADKLYDFLPFILYFDDFSDRVPEKIEISKDKLEQQLKNSKGKTGEWRTLLEEVFKRSSDEEPSIADFVEMSNPDDQTGLLSDVSDKLNDEIITEWKKLKAKGNINFANDGEELELEIKYYGLNENKTKYIFEFKVIDKTFGSRKRSFNIGERSKGFQWYFNFIIKLKFNSKYKIDPTKAIYLLDEPGSYLHSSAQEELIKVLRDISDTNIMFYCTHSQYLLKPDIINLSNINICEKKNGEIEYTKFNSYKSKKTRGALSPLYDALHLSNVDSNFNNKNVVITEGITDYYLMKLLFKYNENFDYDHLILIPGFGAMQLTELISMSIALSNKYLVLFDNDPEGRKAHTKYTKDFGQFESLNFKLYSGINNFQLEDFIVEEDKLRIMDKYNSKDFKLTIPELYFDVNEEFKSMTIRNLSDKHIKNLNGILQKHFNK